MTRPLRATEVITKPKTLHRLSIIYVIVASAVTLLFAVAAATLHFILPHG